MAEKHRLDIETFQRGLAISREKARAMIMAGEVMVNGDVKDKPGTLITKNDTITVKSRPRFVSRGGEKLAGALEDFSINVANRVCADVGASTGGFTDCLLQNGVENVYAIDVGYGQLDYRLRQDERVIVMERTNARYIDKLDKPVDLVVIDASFISLQLLLPTIKNWLSDKADIVALIKPQFEAGKDDVGKGGVVRNSDVHARVLLETCNFALQIGYTIHGLTQSRLIGPAGNVEFLAWLKWGDTKTSSIVVDDIVAQLTTS